MEWLDVIRSFLETGGQVLWVILFATLLLWTLICERFYYFNFVLPKIASAEIEIWSQRAERETWTARRIREKKISEYSASARTTIPFINSLVAVAPMLGLMGTVTGMITVFDVMAVTGTGNARMMASGISMATIPTMAGMVTALSGLFFGARLEQRAQLEVERFTDHLPFGELTETKSVAKPKAKPKEKPKVKPKAESKVKKKADVVKKKAKTTKKTQPKKKD